LVGLLTEFKPVRVMSSPYVRCVETVVPTAAALSVDIEKVDVLAEGSGLAAVELVRSLAGHDLVLCSHGDIIPEVLSALAGYEKLDVGRNPRHEKASVWVLEARKGKFVKARYLRPPS
jgi:8-oxo-dGTP diphosphatase